MRMMRSTLMPDAAARAGLSDTARVARPMRVARRKYETAPRATIAMTTEIRVVRVNVTGDAERVVVTVSDEGPGIRGDISRIFQRFYTDRPDGEHFGDHSGLGLSICRQIVIAHKGTITAENREDRSGARFTVTLPRARK